MSFPTPPFITRQAAAFLMAGALITMTVFATVRTIQLRAQLTAEGEEHTRQQLATPIDLWEDYVTDRAVGWLVLAASGEDLGPREQRARQNTPWFEGIYVWESDPGGVRFLHPPAPFAEDHDRLFRDPCLARAREISRLAPPKAAGAAFVRCRSRSPEVWLLASSLASALLEASQEPELALSVLTEHEPTIATSLEQIGGMGLSLQRQVIRRNQAATLQKTLGLTEDRRKNLEASVREITRLDGAELETVAA